LGFPILLDFNNPLLIAHALRTPLWVVYNNSVENCCQLGYDGECKANIRLGVRRMKACSILFFSALATASAFGQTAKASMSPTEVTAGQTITIAITLDTVPSINGKKIESTTVNVMLSPKDATGNPSSYGADLTPRMDDPKVYTVTLTVPISAKGVWTMKSASLRLPDQSGSIPLETNDPEYTIKPLELTLPKAGKAKITAP
jgi:hypothetical protein